MLSDTEVENVITARLDKTRKVLTEKAKQYAQNGRLGNFHDIAGFMDVTPLQACLGLVSKHIIALKDFINNPDEVPAEQWDEKIGEIIAYMCLMDALVFEDLQFKSKFDTVTRESSLKEMLTVFCGFGSKE